MVEHSSHRGSGLPVEEVVKRSSHRDIGLAVGEARTSVKLSFLGACDDHRSHTGGGPTSARSRKSDERTDGPSSRRTDGLKSKASSRVEGLRRCDVEYWVARSTDEPTTRPLGEMAVGHSDAYKVTRRLEERVSISNSHSNGIVFNVATRKAINEFIDPLVMELGSGLNDGLLKTYGPSQEDSYRVDDLCFYVKWVKRWPKILWRWEMGLG